MHFIKKAINSLVGIDEQNPGRAPNSDQTEPCDVTSRHVFEPIALAEIIKHCYECLLNIYQALL